MALLMSPSSACVASASGPLCRLVFLLPISVAAGAACLSWAVAGPFPLTLTEKRLTVSNVDQRSSTSVSH